MDISTDEIKKLNKRILTAFIKEVSLDRKSRAVFLEEWSAENSATVFVNNWYDSKGRGVKKCPQCGTYNYHYSVERDSWCCAFC